MLRKLNDKKKKKILHLYFVLSVTISCSQVSHSILTGNISHVQQYPHVESKKLLLFPKYFCLFFFFSILSFSVFLACANFSVNINFIIIWYKTIFQRKYSFFFCSKKFDNELFSSLQLSYFIFGFQKIY